ncbi:MAG: hypothetical protein SFW35_00725 [Chitinophagales bacterium]|nr:hypothetical protein [Chitinophagales bacterium]
MDTTVTQNVVTAAGYKAYRYLSAKDSTSYISLAYGVNNNKGSGIDSLVKGWERVISQYPDMELKDAKTTTINGQKAGIISYITKQQNVPNGMSKKAFIVVDSNLYSFSVSLFGTPGQAEWDKADKIIESLKISQ